MRRASKTVSSHLLRIFACEAEQKGMGPEEFSRRVGFTPGEWQGPATRVSRARFQRVVETIAALDLWNVPPIDPPTLPSFEESFPELVTALANAPSGRRAVETFLEFRPLLGEFDWVDLWQDGRRLRVEYQSEWPTGARDAHWHFRWIAGLVRGYGQDLPLQLRVGLTARPPAAAVRAHREAHLGGAVRYDESRNWMELSTGGLDLPNPRYNPLVDRIASRALRGQLRELEAEASLALAVERALRRLLGAASDGQRSVWKGTRTVDLLCAELGTTRWTLRRHLALEGASFRGILAAVRLDLARRLLGETTLSLAEVAERVGFDGPTSFSRFFRAATHASPTEYREAHR